MLFNFKQYSTCNFHLCVTKIEGCKGNRATVNKAELWDN